MGPAADDGVDGSARWKEGTPPLQGLDAGGVAVDAMVATDGERGTRLRSPKGGGAQCVLKKSLRKVGRAGHAHKMFPGRGEAQEDAAPFAPLAAGGR